MDFVLTAIGAAVLFAAIAYGVAHIETQRRRSAGEPISSLRREGVREEAIVEQVESLIERERAHAQRQRAAARDVERKLSEKSAPE